MPPSHFEFHDKRVPNNPLWEIEHRSLDLEPVVITTVSLVYISLLILLCADIQLQVFKWPRVHFTFFFSKPTTITGSSEYLK